MSVLAIDQGTTSTRALVLEDNGETSIIKVIEHQQIYPQSGWVEHDPNELLHNIRSCIEASINLHPDISAIGIDNQGESCLAWHAQTRQAISPVIVWQDARTQARTEKMKADGMEAQILERSGLPLDAYFSATKLAWIMQNIPEAQTLLQQGMLRLGTTDAYFLDNLSGQFVSDVSTASRTSLMNLHSGEWDEKVCNLFGVPIESLPAIVTTTGDFGTYQIQEKSIPITASVCDQQAALYGHGCRNTGDIKITFGTGAFALALTGEQPMMPPDKGLLATIAWQRHKQSKVYALDGGVYNAGAAINWARSLGLFQNYAQINQFSQHSAIEQKLVFVPALSGLACPHWDRKAAGLWIGLTLDTTPMDMMQSVLEGIAFRAAEVIHAIHDLSPIGNRISIDGGLSANPYFCQFLANILNRRISTQPNSEMTATGTALLSSGDNIAYNPNNGASKCYLPNRDLYQYQKHFEQAIERSKKWFA